MLRFVARRCLLGGLTLLVASLLIFAATQILPGDAAQAVLGRDATPARLAALREQLHLYLPAPLQYVRWLTGILHGDLGRSLANGQPVLELVGQRIVNTAFLLGVSAVVSIPLALVLGTLSAVRRDSLLDHATALASLGFAALPEFVVGIGLTVLFGTTVVQVFPPVFTLEPGQAVWSNLPGLILPAATLVLAVMPYLTRIMRGSMVEVMQSDYVEMARLEGLNPWTIVVTHAVPNALAPAAQVVALSLAYLAGGVVVVEYVFNYPGVGAGLIGAVSDRDIPVIQFLSLLLAAFYVTLNLIADVVSIFVTPRLRTTLG